jgi:SNF2 family DNA or RNA helicase
LPWLRCNRAQNRMVRPRSSFEPFPAPSGDGEQIMPIPPITPGIRDNHYCGSVGDFLKPHIQDGTHLSVVSAYFTIYAYAALKERLDRIGHMNFLFGEPAFVRSLDPGKTETKAFIITSDGLKLANALKQKRVARECAQWIRQKVDIRSVCRSNFLHGKLYHVRNGTEDVAVLGSSNFTPRGLGLQDTGSNIELNLILERSSDRDELKGWFDRLWADPDLVADVKDEVLFYLEQVYQNHAPEFIYYKTLYHIFEKFLGDARKTDEDLGKTTLFDSDIWKALFDFQKDGVKGLINKILAHNGCILADSVGLGKTYEALAVIKFFELRNERVLVLCPKKLRDNWTVYRLNDQLNPFGADRFRYDVLSHTDLSRDTGYSGDMNLATLNWSNYDLVVIDESHNFRNNTPGRRDEQGNLIRRSRYQRLMEDIIQSGVRTKVLLISATPVNNDLKDLRNQIYFITAGDDDVFREAIGIDSLKETLRKAQAHFSTWARQLPARRKTVELLVRLGSDFFKLLDELTIARARRHVQEYYAHEMARLGGFPKRLKPVSLYPEIDSKGRFLSYDKLNEEMSGYKLSLFNPWRYVKEQFKELYQRTSHDPFTQADRETFLIGMMKVNFLKRLESSVESFEITMDRTIAKIDSLEQKIAQFKSARKTAEELPGDELAMGMDDDEDLRDAFEVGTKFKYNLAHLNLDDWLKDLKRDKDQLTILHLSARDVTPDRDTKLAQLKTLIAKKAEHPSKNKLGMPNRKVLVFTAFADTAEYLFNHLHAWALNELGIHSALVNGTGDNRTTFRPAGFDRHTEFNHILINFSPISKRREKIGAMPQEGEIDLLIATDCISEGQNLQDCDYVINYDIHWNPVRIIQRFGRVDRIGSVNPTVQMVNFWPTPHLDQYISLKHRVEARMALVDIAATLEENLLKPDELEDLIKEDLRYRDRQLLRLKDEVLDLEDLDDTVSLTEFTLDDFRIDLLKYLEANRSKLDAAAFGLYAVVPPHDQIKTIAPGVIWCFRQKPGTEIGKAASSKPAEQVNPLQPYFLVYVMEDGNVRLGFAHPKQILGIYRELCVGKTTPCDEMCNLFDQETANGANTALYDRLLQKAIDSIVATFRKRLATGLQSGRSFTIPDRQDQATETTDFELVTWLVIKQNHPNDGGVS